MIRFILFFSFVFGSLPALAAKPGTVILWSAGEEDFHKKFPSFLKDLEKILGEKVTTKRETIDASGKIKRQAYKVSASIFSEPVYVAASQVDVVEGAVGATLLKKKYDTEKFIYAGSCGLLSDENHILDVLVPKTFYRSDYEWDEEDGATKLFPEWREGPVKRGFAASYSLIVERSPLVAKVEGLAGSPIWDKGMAHFLTYAGQGVEKNRTKLGINTGVTHVSGGHFIGGKPARDRYRRVFQAQSVDMRAQHIVAAARSVGWKEAIAVLSCADRAGLDAAGDTESVFISNIWSVSGISLFTALMAAAK